MEPSDILLDERGAEGDPDVPECFVVASAPRSLGILRLRTRSMCVGR